MRKQETEREIELKECEHAKEGVERSDTRQGWVKGSGVRIKKYTGREFGNWNTRRVYESHKRNTLKKSEKGWEQNILLKLTSSPQQLR